MLMNPRLPEWGLPLSPLRMPRAFCMSVLLPSYGSQGGGLQGGDETRVSAQSPHDDDSEYLQTLRGVRSEGIVDGGGLPPSLSPPPSLIILGTPLELPGMGAVGR